MDYIAHLHKDSKSDFGVSFPDFPGCVTAGKSLEEARRKAPEALAFHTLARHRKTQLFKYGTNLARS